MVQRPGSLPEFEAQFPDDATCARWLFEKRWPQGFRCPGCGHDKGWELDRGTLLVECARCHRQTSVTAGTVLHRSHLSLKLWFLAAWLVATHKNGISARGGSLGWAVTRRLGCCSRSSAERWSIPSASRSPAWWRSTTPRSPFAARMSRSRPSSAARTKASS
jgi:hypothetical protein